VSRRLCDMGLQRLLCFVALSLAVPATAQTTAPAPTTTVGKPKSSTHHAGPFSAFTKTLPTEKKKPFMELMKKLRGVRNATTGSKEDKKKQATQLDLDIHKTLGTEYKRYRSVQAAAKQEHAAKKGITLPTKKPPPPPPETSAAAGAKKKKSKSGGSMGVGGSPSKLPGSSGKLPGSSKAGKTGAGKKKASTTMGAAPVG